MNTKQRILPFLVLNSLVLAANLASAKPVLPPLPSQAKIKNEVKHALNVITPAQNSVLNEKWKEETKAAANTLTIALYRPTYVLPFFYTAQPYYQVYASNTPNQQRVEKAEFKSQLSFYLPVVNNLFFDPKKTLNIAYTQINFWQVYAASQYFRETNYEPELFIESHFHPNWLYRFGLNHQSNGRGGELERSWNRLIGTVQLSGENWLVGLNVWQLIYPKQSSDLHNPHIARYLGYENILFSYKAKNIVSSVQLQNIESGLHRGSVTCTFSYPFTNHFSLFTQLFTGYGQSLIEYDHRTLAAGIGIAFNDWI